MVVMENGNRDSVRRGYVVERAAYAQVAAVEGLSLGQPARDRFAAFDASGASPAEHLVAIIAAHSAPGAVHVVPHAGGWAVRPAEGGSGIGTYGTQAEAIARGRQAAEARRGELLVHGRDGRLLRRTVFGAGA
ncbi:DUF2188 domain-containing protein [Falsiroseomonas stagni]|uniref:DUF2188 domain-containing protein n=1 Tax=Falsiroseomonas stagni DSM 19981 TaxID=1123062 RepID=A0A1I4DH51_9PROT|nr:DUF2188 domain-containing protein [Falsiroseomonas stagni]SFK92802.1 hypothetical protein SAMN02745775_1113 [Falsiroseomonas stagni DSM 19981]